MGAVTSREFMIFCRGRKFLAFLNIASYGGQLSLDKPKCVYRKTPREVGASIRLILRRVTWNGPKPI